MCPDCRGMPFISYSQLRAHLRAAHGIRRLYGNDVVRYENVPGAARLRAPPPVNADAFTAAFALAWRIYNEQRVVGQSVPAMGPVDPRLQRNVRIGRPFNVPPSQTRNSSSESGATRTIESSMPNARQQPHVEPEALIEPEPQVEPEPPVKPGTVPDKAGKLYNKCNC